MVDIRLSALRQFAKRAGEACLKLPRRKSSVLSTLPEVNVILVSDRRITAIHARFMNEPGPTDVITFQHGEVFISTETAKRQAREFGTTLEDELRLYIAHGLLHLHGYDDKSPAGAAEMKRTQEKLVVSLL
jgi:probable rRNA maturation factor